MTPEEKTEAVRRARLAIAAAPSGVIPLDRCPYPLDSESALHWLAIVLWLGALVR